MGWVWVCRGRTLSPSCTHRVDCGVSLSIVGISTYNTINIKLALDTAAAEEEYEADLNIGHPEVGCCY